MKDIKKTEKNVEMCCRQDKIILLIICLHLWHRPVAEAIHPECAIISEHLRAQEMCSQTRRSEAQNQTDHSGCKTDWDDIRCWLRAEVGQVVNVSCSEVLQHFSSNQGFVYRNCNIDGWSEIYPPYEEACAFSDDSEPESETSYLSTFRQVYTVGYATSLISLITAIVVFTAFRKFRCTRNYIHINLFSSFVLRASAVFIKDTVLFADETLDHCSMSTTACKSAVAFFQFSILANYFWLLVEGMYLQTLLALTFVSQRKYFWWYILIGWEAVKFLEVRKFSTLLILGVNIVIFINVIRILVQKLKSSAMTGNNDTGHFMRLAKSTLFLIPLFGMHYTVFAFLPETTGVAARLYIELGLGSFQGFVVALLYCFMNGEVQTELRRWLRKCHSQNHLTPAKRSITQITIRASGGLGRPPSSGNISSV
ncbi:Vasoactive intestinal polypeptide receptor 1 [Collichthys lucidus]|uniref:Vasoactive intestinal polypeptide receptor 1 n=1 Tax=Collichthys lucidus TaxID=240159 RepID=A0A4U5UWL9_COLLU|nr:Vasoactive intestinal polypeptide receptor 1 [Collichthys lucidus]